jgi:hypothetical protein
VRLAALYAIVAAEETSFAPTLAGIVVALTDSFVLFCYFGLFSLWSFGYKLYRYGHELAPTAAVKVTG